MPTQSEPELLRPRFALDRERQAAAYQTVARAIGFLIQRVDDPPPLAQLAAHVGLSKDHLQRVFSDWAGISPKRFMQVLSLWRARRALATESVLEAAFAAGLSGPGRLHDLAITCEAVTPGELKSAGEGLEVRWGSAATALGPALIGATSRGVCHLEFFDDGVDAALARLRATWARATLVEDPSAAAGLAERIFGRPERLQPLHLLVKGTNFQVQVWRALLQLAPGSTTTYGALARALGRPSSARAVAGAVARNSIAILVPCHRVLREDGALGGYRWGAERKAAALALEACAGDETAPAHAP